MTTTENQPVISKRIQEVIKGLEIAQVFRAKYESKLPPDVGEFLIMNKEPYFTISIEYDEDNRSNILTLFGDVFGRDGWVAKLEYRGRHFNWTKFVDGVRVCIEAAQTSSQPEEFPVPAKAFPLQLL